MNNSGKDSPAAAFREGSEQAERAPIAKDGGEACANDANGLPAPPKVSQPSVSDDEGACIND